MIKKLKIWFYKRKIMDVQRFAHSHKNYLVIVCDPKDDTMFMSYRGKQISSQIKCMDGKNHHVLKNLLKDSTFEREIDRFIGGITDALKAPMKGLHNTFYSWLDGGLFNIAKALKKTK